MSDNEERYRTLFENNPHPMFVYDLETLSFLAVNDAAVDRYGYSRDEFLTMTIKDIRPPGDIPALMDNLSKPSPVLERAGVWRHRKKDGTLIDVEITSHQILFGGRGARLVLADDVTERIRAEKALRESQEQHRNLFENAPIGIYRTTPDGRILMANPTLVRILGYASFEELASRNLEREGFEATHMRDRFKKLLERDGEVRGLEFAWTRRDNTVIFIRENAKAVRGQDGAILYYEGTVEDISERKQAEEALQESREYSRQIVETANEAFVEINADGLITDWNRMAEVTFGWPREEAVGKSMSALIIPTQHREAHERGLRHFLATGEGPVLNRRIEIAALYRGGHEFPVELTIWPIRRGASYSFNAFVQDITERKRAEEALRESNRRLEEALAELRATQQQVIQQERLRALGQMASGIAHDFNNALSPILGFSELLLMIPESLDDKEKVARYLKTIHTAAQDAANIVSRLREFYRHREKGEFFEPVSLNQVVVEAISLTQPKWKDQAQANGVTIDVQADLQQVPLIAGNEAELREVLTNLIFNAVDAMSRDGGITLRTRPDGGLVVLEVSDTGAGMTEEVRQRCLEPFFSTKGDRGTGLGLSMVFGIVQRHEGTIDIETEPGRGTTFSIRLPAMNERRTGEGRQGPATLSRFLHVLVVDDDPTVRELISAYLTNDGHTVEVAISGQEGLEKFQRGRYDLVMTDRAMPEMSGDQVAAAVKRLAPHKPVIMLTGFGDMMQAADEHPAGVDVVISKPVTRSKLREALGQVQ